MRALEKLLRYTTARERFQSVCVTNAEHSKCFDHWSLSLKSLRWEAIFEFAHGLRPLQELLKKYWDGSKYAAGLSGTKYKRFAYYANDDDDSFGPSMTQLDSVIHNESFWSAISIVEQISYESEFVGRWAEGCDLLQFNSHFF